MNGMQQEACIFAASPKLTTDEKDRYYFRIDLFPDRYLHDDLQYDRLLQ